MLGDLLGIKSFFRIFFEDIEDYLHLRTHEEWDLVKKINEDLSKDNLNDPSSLSIETLKGKIEKIQDYLDFKVQVIT